MNIRDFWHCELVHVKTGEVIRDVFVRNKPGNKVAPLDGNDHVNGFAWRATPLVIMPANNPKD